MLSFDGAGRRISAGLAAAMDRLLSSAPAARINPASCQNRCRSLDAAPHTRGLVERTQGRESPAEGTFCTLARFSTFGNSINMYLCLTVRETRRRG